MSAFGKWADGGLFALYADSDAFFPTMSVMKLWTNDYTPASGWVPADLGVLSGTQANATIPSPWASPTFVSSGVYLRTTPDPWQFGFAALLTDTPVYGFVLGPSVVGGPYFYAERFRDAPRVVNAASFLSIKPLLYLHNNDVSPPEPEVVPTGAMMPFAVSSAPAGWLLCDGTVYAIATYPALGAMLGATYGGDGLTTFGVPNPQCHVIGASGAFAGLTARAVGVQAGAETHALTSNENGPHIHAPVGGGNMFLVNPGAPPTGSAAGPGAIGLQAIANTASSGLGTPHNNVQPSQFFPWYIKT